MKQHFAAKHFASKHFACGHFAGIGVAPPTPSTDTPPERVLGGGANIPHENRRALAGRHETRAGYQEIDGDGRRMPSPKEREWAALAHASATQPHHESLSRLRLVAALYAAGLL